jgi:hypothetical protein
MSRRHQAIAMVAGAFFAAMVQPAFAQVANNPSSPATRWEVLASCAAAYLANWQNRLSDPNRGPDMSNMIKEEFEQYKLAAIGSYEKDRKTSKDEADRSVDGHVKANLVRFIAMDKAGTLEAYIDKCPQPEEPN